jgi:hypothetical protein
MHSHRAFLGAAALLPAWAAQRFRCGHHFYNWDQKYDLDLKLRLTKETG